MRVELVEQMVLSPPPKMDGWRMYRIEYGGHAEQCIIEGLIWLPPGVPREAVEKLFRRRTGDTMPGKD